MQILKDNNVKENNAVFNLDPYLLTVNPNISEEEVKNIVLNDLGRALIQNFLEESWKNRTIKQEYSAIGMQFRASLFMFSMDYLLYIMEEAFVAGMKHNRDLNCQNSLNPLPSNLPVKLKDSNNA